jgi:hypothetical protein
VSPRAIAAKDLTGKDWARIEFYDTLRQAGIPRPQHEYRFAPPRRWMFDYAWADPEHMVALEVEGGVWIKGGGRHNRGAGYLRDVEKYNRATVLGWRVVRCTPDTLCSVETLDMLKALLSFHDAATD